MILEKTLDEVIADIIQAICNAGYATGSIENFTRIYKRLQKLAKSREEAHYNPELGQMFIEDSKYANSHGYCDSRYCYHTRCIHFIESYIKYGEVDWAAQKRLPRQSLK